MKLIEALRTGAHTQPQGVAVVEAEQSLSYEQLWQLVEQTAVFLTQHKVDRLALALSNQLAWVVLDLSAQLSRTTLIPVPLFFTPQQKQHAIIESGASFLIETGTHHAGAILVAEFPLLNITLYKTNVADKTIPDHTAKITFTSGSTGTPKGVCLSQSLLDDVSEQLAYQLRDQLIQRHVVLLPFGILLENIAGIYVPLLLGATIILPTHHQRSFMNRESLVDALTHYQPNSLLLTAQGLCELLQVAEQFPELIKSLHYVAVGGSKISPSLLEQAEKLHLPVYEGYGLSECGSVVSLNTPAHHRIGSVGKVLPNTTIYFGDDGEILVERSHLLGYTSDVSSPMVIHTGDLGYMDKEGYLFVNGRKKNIFINSFGRNFSPEWIEAEAQRYTSITYLVLFGDAKPFNVAIIQAATHDMEVLEQDITHLNKQLPDYARITYYLVATEPFSLINGLLTSNGRPRRAEIYQCYADQLEQLYRKEVAL